MILKEFEDRLDTLNIELGAGCGNFGQIYYKECFLTDNESVTGLSKRCNNDFFANIQCDAYNIRCQDGRFEKVILCNPYRYGFRDRDEAQTLFKELHRVLIDKGEVIVVTTNVNPYAVPDVIERELKIFNSSGKRFEMLDTRINHTIEYKGYKFYTSSGQETYPSHKVVLTCLK